MPTLPVMRGQTHTLNHSHANASLLKKAMSFRCGNLVTLASSQNVCSSRVPPGCAHEQFQLFGFLLLLLYLGISMTIETPGNPDPFRDLEVQGMRGI